MRGLELLQLLQDQPKNTPVRVTVAGVLQNIDDFDYAVVGEQPRLQLHPKPDGKPLKVWEVMLLIDKPEWRKAYAYLVTDTESRPLFGYQITAASLNLN